MRTASGRTGESPPHTEPFLSHHRIFETFKPGRASRAKFLSHLRGLFFHVLCQKVIGEEHFGEVLAGHTLNTVNGIV